MVFSWMYPPQEYIVPPTHQVSRHQSSYSTMTTSPTMVTSSPSISMMTMTTTSQSATQPPNILNRNYFKPIVVSTPQTKPPNGLRVKEIATENSKEAIILDSPMGISLWI